MFFAVTSSRHTPAWPSPFTNICSPKPLLKISSPAAAFTPSPSLGRAPDLLTQFLLPPTSFSSFFVFQCHCLSWVLNVGGFVTQSDRADPVLQERPLQVCTSGQPVKITINAPWMVFHSLHTWVLPKSQLGKEELLPTHSKGDAGAGASWSLPFPGHSPSYFLGEELPPPKPFLHY